MSEATDFAFQGDETHPDQRDYMATNILANIDRLPKNGDWWFNLKDWAQANSTGRIQPNPTRNDG